MIKLSTDIRDINDKLPINKREFMKWFLDILKEGDSLESFSHQIENSSYSYYRKGYYWKLNSYNIIRGLLACVDLSVYWHKSRFQYGEYSLSPYINKNRLYLTRFSFRFLSYLQENSNIFGRIDDFIYMKLQKGELYSQQEIFDVVCEKYGGELMEIFKSFCESNPLYRYRLLSDFVTPMVFNLPSSLVVDVFATVFNQYRHYNSSNRMDLIIKVPDQNMISFYPSDFEGYYHVFNFFGYLKRKGVSRLTKNEVIIEIDNYCSHLKIKGSKILKKILLNSYFGNKSIFKEISSIFQKRISHLNYDKFQAAYCHCLALLENDDDFKKAFLDNHYDKLDSTTAEIINIYYCEQDLKGELSGYNTINKFEKESGIDIGEENLPAIMLWLEDIKKFEIVRLFELDMQNCFYVIRKLKVAIKHGINNSDLSIHEKNNIFINAVQIAKEEVQKLLKKQREKNSQINYITINGDIEALQQNFGNSKGIQYNPK